MPSIKKRIETLKAIEEIQKGAKINDMLVSQAIAMLEKLDLLELTENKKSLLEIICKSNLSKEKQ